MDTKCRVYWCRRQLAYDNIMIIITEPAMCTFRFGPLGACVKQLRVGSCCCYSLGQTPLHEHVVQQVRWWLPTNEHAVYQIVPFPDILTSQDLPLSSRDQVHSISISVFKRSFASLNINIWWNCLILLLFVFVFCFFLVFFILYLYVHYFMYFLDH